MLPRRQALLLAAALSSAAGALSAPRETVSLDFGVRFSPFSAASCAFPNPLNNVQCQNLNHAADAADAPSCAAAACAAAAQVWQFRASDGCWVGALSSCIPGAGWAGGGRNASGPGPSPPEAQLAYDDSAWAVVDTPHDATILNNYSQSANGGQAFLPPAVSWYRKRFRVPAEWAGSVVTLVVDGSLSTSTWWLNGAQLVAARPNGYLPLVLRLDTAGLVPSGGANVLTAYVDGGETTGWWYESSGLMRNWRLVATSPTAAIAPFGVASPAFVSGSYHAHGSGTPAEGLFADAATLTPTATLASAAPGARVSVRWQLYAADGATLLASETSPAKAAPAQGDVTSAGMALTAVELWTVARPYLHTLVTAVLDGASGAVLDTVNTSVGIRDLAWDAERGLQVNEQAIKMRGACNHESFAGVGGALAPRVDLLRVQQMRGVGMNAWRTSHNPPEPVLLDITDRLGVLVLDENRVLATRDNCDGCPNVPEYAGDPAADMGALALRDRNHASVAWYSLCNEAGCGNGSLLSGDLVEHAKEAAYTYDGSRAVGANMGWLSPVTPRTMMSDALDVMGFSHDSYETVLAFHKAEPGKPLAMTECCSCETQRGEDADVPHNASSVYFSDFNADCLAGQTQVSNAPTWMSGTFVWTLHDYMGEPGNWPHISSSFGAFDLAGLPKSPVWWYRSWWLGNISASDPSRPPLPAASSAHFCRIVESWAANPAAPATRTIHVYTNAPYVALANPAVPPAPVPVSPFGYATFRGVAFTPGSSLTATCLAADGASALASHTARAWGAPAALRLSLDAPSLATGTGRALYLDGSDVALVRASVVDAGGNVCGDAAVRIAFGVSAGPGRVWGSGSGDPSDHEHPNAASRVTYHGLARAVVRAALVGAGSDAERAALAYVNVDAGVGGGGGSGAGTAPILPPGQAPPTVITVTASAPGLASASIDIALSVDEADSVLSVAAASVGAADVGE